MKEEDAKKFHNLFNQFWKAISEGPVEGDLIKNSFGFSISIGEDGVPKIQAFNSIDTIFQQPLTDMIEFSDHYEIIMETPGINNEEQITIEFIENGLNFQAVNDDIAYRTRIELSTPVSKSYELQLKNRTLIINIPKI